MVPEQAAFRKPLGSYTVRGIVAIQLTVIYSDDITNGDPSEHWIRIPL